MDKYIGWKAYEGHPVYDFMTGNRDIYVEDIRQDTVSGIYYKYAYVKSQDGSFVQIGVLADKIHMFLGQFEFNNLINDFYVKSGVAHISFINNEYKVIASSIPDYEGMVIEDEGFKARISGQEYSTLRSVQDNQNVFIVWVPVFHGGEKHGTLSISWKTAEIDAEIIRVIHHGCLLLVILLSFMGGILYYAYRKNKSNLKIAYYDKLTGLPNNEYLEEYLAEEIKNIDKNKKAIFLLNCANIRILNMTYGFAYGDKIIHQIAGKVQSVLRPDDTLFRFGSDRFILVIDSYNNRDELIDLAQKLISIFESPFEGKTGHQYVSAEIGIVEIRDKNITVDKLLQDATLALSHMDGSLCDSIQFFEKEMEDAVRQEDTIEKALRAVINDDSRDTLYLHFQPKVDIKRNTVAGFEALARLHIDGVGNISPVRFIEIAEKRHLIYDLGKQILHKACEFIKNANENTAHSISVAVNISGIQLLRDEFVEDIREIVRTHSIDMSSLEFEITESVLLDNFDLINKKLGEIKRMGISISLDDFGTGFSSLSRLRELNIDTVKIDKYFIDKIRGENDSDLIVADIISMAHKIGLSVVAEGVEKDGQMAYLKKHDSDIIQGYLFSKPVSEAEAIDFLKIFETQASGLG